jgi:hypothetical protein
MFPKSTWSRIVPILIIEPADLDTSEDVDPAIRVIDESAERIAASFGLQRVMHYAADVPWTRPYAPTLTPSLHAWMRNARTRTALRVEAAQDHPRERSTNPFGDGDKPTRIGLSVIREA